VLSDQTVAGYLHLHSVTDYYTESKNGHVADLVVAQIAARTYEQMGFKPEVTRLLKPMR
jgi:hypothetical protein